MELVFAHQRTPAGRSTQNGSASTSLRSSSDNEYLHDQDCAIGIYDDAPEALDARPYRSDEGSEAFAWQSARPSVAELKERLTTRDPMKTRWINVVGWSRPLLDAISEKHLGNHQCLAVEPISKQMLGGPVELGSQGRFIWLQTEVWFVGKRAPLWSSIRHTRLRVVVCLPTATHAGTLITNFLGCARLPQELSSLCLQRILRDHSLGRQALGCVWILAFSLLRFVAEQLDFAFEIFDPIDSSPKLPTIPKLDDLPVILEKSNRLARIDRYLSTLKELACFFLSVQQLLPPESTPESRKAFQSKRNKECARLEASRAREKIQHEQRLCRTYMKQFDSLVQLVISYSTTQITERLDYGRTVAEQFSKIGVFLAGLAAIVAPMSLLTGYYGMNVKEMTPGATATLFQFWQIGVPMLITTGVSVVFITLWILTRSERTYNRR